jgi:FkbM family methyltransferase
MKISRLAKVRRELWRIWLHIKVTVIRGLGLNVTMRYADLDFPLNRQGITAEIVMGIASGMYEQPEIAGLSHVLRPGDRVLELGAGLGVVTALIARAISPGGEVLSYEADPKLLPETREFLTRHGLHNVEVRNAVLVPHAAPGESRSFHVSRVFAVSSLVPLAGSKRHKTISVPAEGVNDVIGTFKPNVLICDIEGGEAELIPALDARGLRAVVIEMHPKRISAELLSAVRDALERQGLIKDPKPFGGTVELYQRVEA